MKTTKHYITAALAVALLTGGCASWLNKDKKQPDPALPEMTTTGVTPLTNAIPVQ